MKFRKKPVVIEAYQTNIPIDIKTLEGVMHANPGDWIITGVNGEQYPCKPDIFEKTYEPADNEPEANVEPVIHCKDCMHGCPEKGHETDVHCSWWDYPMPPTGFCSKARKVEIYQDLDDIYEDYTGATEENFNDMMREKEKNEE